MKLRGTVAKGLLASLRRMRLGIAVFLVFVAFALAGGVVLRDTLLRNAYETNTALARYYASETDSDLTTYEALLDFGTAAVEARVYADEPWGSLESWATLYCERLRSVLGNDSIDVYGVIEGQVLNVGGSLPQDDFDPTERVWYQQALANPGSTIFTNVYVDELTGKNVVTAACASRTEDAVLAFDIYPETFGFRFGLSGLPEGASYFLCDGAGVDLYHHTDLPEDEVDAYLAELVGRIEAGELTGYTSFVEDSRGEQRAVDYVQMPNGWYSIVTVPYSTILGRLETVYLTFGAMTAIFAAALAAMTVRDWRINRDMERTNETVRVLGNSYYAIYLVNYEESTYEMIKGSDYVRERIPPKGPYGDLLRTAGEIMQESTFKEFEEHFSAENIRELVARRTRDYGGDFMRKFGDRFRWVNVRVLYDESLAPEEVVLCFREVDQEKQRQLQERRYLEQALEASQASMESRQAFFNNMSHDMRTPLNAVIGLTELARRDVGDAAKTTDYLRRIEQSGRQLLALINDILDISRMESGKVSLALERMDLPQVVRDVVAPFELQAKDAEKNLSLAVDVRDAWVFGDPARLGQVMNNLLSNALKYTRPGDAVRVRVTQERSGEVGSYQFVIADTGIGMSPEYLPHIFDLYAREQRFGTPQAVGTGLGMPITKSLVTQMGGSISVESELEVGTTITVTLPFSPAPEAPAATYSPTPQVAADMPADGPELLQGARIILAEDNEINMEISTELLGAAGVEVVQAWNGREAVDAFAASAPGSVDAILLDMKMPVMDGCDAAKSIRALERPDARTVPIVAVTANAFAEDIAATTAAGMDAHVSKPIDFSVLCRTLSGLMARRGWGRP